MTLAYSAVGTIIDKADVNSTYIVATANDTTATVTGKIIDNRDGMVSYVGAQFVATNQTGTSPTLQLVLQASNDGTNWVTALNEAGSAIQSSATSISTASSTAVIVSVNTAGSLLRQFPAFLRWEILVGGSSTPGGTYVVSATTVRDKFSTVRV